MGGRSFGKIPEEQFSRGLGAPVPQTSLECSELAAGVSAGVLLLEAYEQLNASLVRISLKPLADFGPAIDKRVGAPEARAACEEITAPEVIEQRKIWLEGRALRQVGDQGRPTKKNRRALEERRGFFE